MSEPDDTPTRLQRLLFEAGDDEVGPACSRVEVPPTLVMDPEFREPYVQGYRHALWDARMAERAEVSRLQQENALLRRSLAMLTKQIEEAEREASIATEELQHPRD